MTNRQALDLKFRAEGRCRLCQRLGSVRQLTRHRIVPGAFGGAYVPANVVPLCRPCHDEVDNRNLRDRLRARRMLRAVLWPVEIAHATRRTWHAAAHAAVPARRWNFDAAYPRPPRELVEERRAASHYALGR